MRNETKAYLSTFLAIAAFTLWVVSVRCERVYQDYEAAKNHEAIIAEK